MKKKLTQKDRILALFLKKKWVKVQELHAIAWRYGAVLFELRKSGLVFAKRIQKDCRLEEWNLVTKFRMKGGGDV